MGSRRGSLREAQLAVIIERMQVIYSVACPVLSAGRDECTIVDVARMCAQKRRTP